MARRARRAAATFAVAAGIAALVVRFRRNRIRTTASGTPHGGSRFELDDLAARSRRSMMLARLGLRAGGDYATMRARSVVADEERREQLRGEYELRTAAQVTETLGHMKGALMKLGQMASYLDQGLPEPVREALASLQTDAPPMAPALVAGVILAELGGSPREVFSEWEESPLAAASIGQVHRAVTHDGVEVAVKVQYPGVDVAIAADMDNTEVLFSLLGVMFPGMDPEPIVTELRDRVMEELDYVAEADNQMLFADAYRGHPFIGVPDVIRELSTQRVLTTRLAHGSPFSEVVTWPDEERQLAAETLYRFVFGSIYNLGAFNGDPHPGNYLFRPGGEVTFLDFGLCRRFSADEVAAFENMIVAIVLQHDIGAFRDVLDEVGILERSAPFSDAEIEEYFGHFYEFVMNPGVQQISSEYAADSVRRFFDLAGPYGAILKRANLPASMVIIQRINLGLYALFGELRARNDWRRIAEELWPFVDAPVATPMGQRIARWEADHRRGATPPT